MEAYSVEDKGKGICFNVFVYNVQPGITINYETGESCCRTAADGETYAERHRHYGNGGRGGSRRC